jgi:hypothetical protein
MYSLTLMLFLLLQQTVHLSPPTVMLVGDLSLALQSATALSFLFSNFGV